MAHLIPSTSACIHQRRKETVETFLESAGRPVTGIEPVTSRSRQRSVIMAMYVCTRSAERANHSAIPSLSLRIQHGEHVFVLLSIYSPACASSRATLLTRKVTMRNQPPDREAAVLDEQCT